MKKVLGIILSIFLLFSCHQPNLRIYLVENNTIIPTSKVFDSTSEILKFGAIGSEKPISNEIPYNIYQIGGYTNEQINNSKIKKVYFKFFTNEIAFIVANNGSPLEIHEVHEYIKDYNPKSEFNVVQQEHSLSLGITLKAISKDYMELLLKKRAYDDILNNNEYTFYFNNGYLSSYILSNRLNKNAKNWKQDKISKSFLRCEKRAQIYRGKNTPEYFAEINSQSNARAMIPHWDWNEYAKFHTSNSGDINFKMLHVAHYGGKIILPEFKAINYGRYELKNEYNQGSNKRTIYKINRAHFTFDDQGELKNSTIY